MVQIAIDLERNGEMEKAGQAFAAAVRHTKNANTLVNLGGTNDVIETVLV